MTLRGMPVPPAGFVDVFGYEGREDPSCEVYLGTAAFLDETDRVVNAASKLSTLRKHFSRSTESAVATVPPVRVPAGRAADGLTFLCFTRGSPLLPIVLSFAESSRVVSVLHTERQDLVLFASFEDLKSASRPAAQVVLSRGDRRAAELLDHEIRRARVLEELGKEPA